MATDGSPAQRQLEDAKRDGAPVKSSDGDFLGEVETIYYDTETGEPEWIGVRSGFLPSRRVLVPVRGVRVEGGSLTVHATKAEFEAAPKTEDEELSPEDEERLFAHYDLAREETATAVEPEDDVPSVVRHEEELLIGRRREELGLVLARKRLETELVEATVPYEIEHVTIERLPAEEGDSGLIETLPDGISIPVLEEELVVEKEIVVRERVIIRKEPRIDVEVVEADLRVERVDVDLGPGTESVLDAEGSGPLDERAERPERGV